MNLMAPPTKEDYTPAHGVKRERFIVRKDGELMQVEAPPRPEFEPIKDVRPSYKVN